METDGITFLSIHDVILCNVERLVFFSVFRLQYTVQLMYPRCL